MIHNKEFEEKAFELLKPMFDEVIWLSRNSKSPIDFKCRKDNQIFWIEAKQNSRTKITLLPAQKNVDGVVMLINGEMKLIWKKDFQDWVLIGDLKLIKISSKIKKKLDNLKKYPRETYNDVLERLLP